jgi:hypothetical protein
MRIPRANYHPSERKKFPFLLHHQDRKTTDEKFHFFPTESYEKCSKRADGGLFTDEKASEKVHVVGSVESTQSPLPLS